MLYLGFNVNVAGGVVVGFIAMFLLYALSMFLYSLAKRIWTRHKWKAEVVTIGVAVSISFAIKLAVYLMLNNGVSVGSGMNSIWHALYATIGGLTFEGLEEVDCVGAVWQSLYYGSSVYAGLLVLSVLTMKWNYEMNSFFILVSPKPKRDIYVFTALNEETLQLAESIKQEYDCDNEKRKMRKPLIIFSGPKLDAFERNDDLCRRVVSDGFLYWSYYKENPKKSTGKIRKFFGIGSNNKFRCRSIAEILHIKNKNIRRGVKDKAELRVCVFAYDSVKHIPEEENNIGFVFEDIKNRINRNKKDSLRIEYFILTKRDINYQAYDYKNRELMLDFAESFANKKIKKILKKNQYTEVQSQKLQTFKQMSQDEEFKKVFLMDGCEKFANNATYQKWAEKLKSEFSRYTVITAVNEALIISKDAIEDLSLPFEIGEDRYDKCGEKLNVFILGFGSTGQAIAKAIHMRTAYINSAGYATDIHFEVFDSKAKDIGGLFVKENPMWVCNDEEHGEHMSKDKKMQAIYRTERMGKLFGKNIENDEDWEFVKQEIEKEIIFPSVCFNSKSCFDLGILEKLDNVTGAYRIKDDGNGFRIAHYPSIIAITLGSDYDNVRMANALISDIKREGKIREESEAQTIIVNIWDNNNNDLLNSAGGVWTDDHKSLYLEDVKLTVKIVGNNTDIYSYKKMAYHDDFAKYNAGYNKMSDDIKHKYANTTLKNLEEYFTDGADPDFKELKSIIDGIEKSYVKSQDSKALEAYENRDMWKRESTDCVLVVKEMFYKLTEKELRNGKNNVEICKYLSRVEHQRWLRLHIANGWFYGDEKNTLLKKHNSLIPFNKLQNGGSLYNLINALLIDKDLSEEHLDENEKITQDVSENKNSNLDKEDILPVVNITEDEMAN